MIYGRLTEAEQTKRDLMYGPGYPFIENGGRVYRITELVQTAVGHANYQAVEADFREVEQWLEANKPKPPPPPAPKLEPPEPVLTPPEQPKFVEEAILPPPPPDVPPHSEQGYPSPKPGFKPRLADFARTQGAYRGYGRISNDIVEKYKSIYGDPPPLSEAAKAKKELFKKQTEERRKARIAERRATQFIPVDKPKS